MWSAIHPSVKYVDISLNHENEASIAKVTYHQQPGHKLEKIDALSVHVSRCQVVYI